MSDDPWSDYEHFGRPLCYSCGGRHSHLVCVTAPVVEPQPAPLVGPADYVDFVQEEDEK